MSEAPRPQRRLAAILAADVVGYSRLMQRDEVGTLDALRSRRREILDPTLARFGGRVVKLMGDGVLAEFASVVDAVECAARLQQAMDQANRDEPEDRRIVLRIGINLGDIVVEGDDLYGDGVNIAARLEALAEPGGILVSQAVADHAGNRTQLAFEALGARELKNIAGPVQVCRVIAAGRPAPPVTAAPAAAPPAKPSVAVLPFANLSGDQEQEYFSDGITEDIITDLSKVPGLFVLGRNTVFALKGKPDEIPQIARRLKVAYVLEGSVRKAGQRVRITAQLSDGGSGGQVWAERFDRTLDDVFAIQDEIAKSVVEALKIKLIGGELRNARSTWNVGAYECYLQGRSLLHENWSGKPMLRAARKMFERAVQIDPAYDRALAGMADCDAFLWIAGDLDVSFETMLANSGKALELSPDLAEAHASRALALYLSGRRDEAGPGFERAIALDGDLWAAWFFYGMSSRGQGQLDKAARLFARAAELNQSNWLPVTMLSDVLEAMGRHDEALAAARRSLERIRAGLERRPDNADAVSLGAATLVYLDEFAAAEEWADRAVLLDPDSFGVRYNYACTHAVIGNPDRAMDALERIYARSPRARGWLLGMVRNDTQMNPLRDRPDFRDLVARLEQG
ncbi:MAG: adenylate/guanylate cyclase domain-containing protein [Dongiaceae bacterium]